jgi:hypothetical protein
VAYAGAREASSDVRGAFYLKVNWPGRARQVANAGFIVAQGWRNKELGWLLGATMLQYTKDPSAIEDDLQLVFSENQPGRHLLKSLGFAKIGRIPGAVRRNDGIIRMRSSCGSRS